MIHLDTNVVIALLNGRPRQVRRRFDEAQAEGQTIALSSIALHELFYGAARSERRAGNEEKISLFLASGVEVLPFTDEDAGHAGDIRAFLARSGNPIGPYDVLIAAQARRQAATLVTANRAEFSRVPGLAIVDWER